VLVPSYDVKPLDESTWPDFADLVERNGGVWGGCWCMGFHPEAFGSSPEESRDRKLARVRTGDAHAALVYDGHTCVGWCQFGSSTELTRLKNRKAYEQGLTDLPDWRITCFYVDKTRRRQGVSDAALAGALDLIARHGGGTVESYPEDTEARKVSSSFLHNGTVGMFERHGFTRDRRIGKDRWVVRNRVRAGKARTAG
jgi:GNAT superfamily N-acetyltransferase